MAQAKAIQKNFGLNFNTFFDISKEKKLVFLFWGDSYMPWLSTYLITKDNCGDLRLYLENKRFIVEIFRSLWGVWKELEITI